MRKAGSQFQLRWFLLPLVLWFAGCASAPVQEMSDARQAIEAARAAGADRFAEDLMAEANGLLRQAEVELERGDYRSARRAALTAREQAMTAREVAEHSVSAVDPP